MSILLTAILVALLLLGVLAGTAHAYLEPGTGSLIIQAIVAAVAGSLVAIRVWWRQVSMFFADVIGAVLHKKKPPPV